MKKKSEDSGLPPTKGGRGLGARRGSAHAQTPRAQRPPADVVGLPACSLSSILARSLTRG
eukprot:scaffold25688_cov26-Tisochrysis_lutea.AAC.1